MILLAKLWGGGPEDGRLELVFVVCSHWWWCDCGLFTARSYQNLCKIINWHPVNVSHSRAERIWDCAHVKRADDQAWKPWGFVPEARVTYRPCYLTDSGESGVDGKFLCRIVEKTLG